MGSKEDKIKLGTEILNMNIKAYKAVFESYPDKFPCIYLFSAGKVGFVRNTFGIDATVPDDHMVYKFGCSTDFAKRCVQLGDEYNKLPNVQLKLSVFHMVDTKYTFEAEGEIRTLCKSFKKNLKTEGYNELIILDATEHEMVKKYYRRIGNEYAGATAELQHEVLALKDRIKELEWQMELQKEQMERKLAEKEYLLDRERILLDRERMTTEMLRSQIVTNELISKLNIELAEKNQLLNSRSTNA
jgi:hypothetical protein